MAGYYRGFCANFASVVSPLTELLKADVKYVWAPICQQAFAQVKNLLSSAPVLSAPWLDLPFKSGDVGSEAFFFLQTDEKVVERPVSYFKLYKRHYSVIEK